MTSSGRRFAAFQSPTSAGPTSFRAHLTPTAPSTDVCDDGWISEAELIDAAARQGYSVRHDQLRGFRRAGLIPDSKQHWPKRQRAGSVNCYPPLSLDLLLQVCAIHDHASPDYEKRLDIVGFKLWWRGSEFHRPVARRALAWYLDTTWAPLRNLSAEHSDPYAVADAVDALFRGADFRSAFARLLGRRLRRNEQALLSAFYAIILVVQGETPTWTSTASIAEAIDEDELSPAEAAAALFATDRMTQDAVAGIGSCRTRRSISPNS